MDKIEQPEMAMPRHYRAREVKYILNETRKLNSVAVLQYQSSSYGSTRLLRYICYNPSVKRDSDYFYIDNNWLLTFSPEKTLENLEDMLKSSSRTCCIVVGQINSENSERTFTLLSSFRAMHKNQVCYLVEVRLREGEQLDDLPKQFRNLIAGNYFFIKPLNSQDFLQTLKDIAKKYGRKLTSKNLRIIQDTCQGDLLRAKEIISNKNMDVHVGNVANTSSVAVKPRLTVRAGYLRVKERLIEGDFTKNESLILKLFLTNPEVVSRDEIARLLAPATLGDGVTNELIDQSVSRLRKKLTKLDIRYSIITIRGRGYRGSYC